MLAVLRWLLSQIWGLQILSLASLFLTARLLVVGLPRQLGRCLTSYLLSFFRVRSHMEIRSAFCKPMSEINVSRLQEYLKQLKKPATDVYKINNLTSAFTNTYNNTRYPARCLLPCQDSLKMSKTSGQLMLLSAKMPLVSALV